MSLVKIYCSGSVRFYRSQQQNNFVVVLSSMAAGFLFCVFANEWFWRISHKRCEFFGLLLQVADVLEYF